MGDNTANVSAADHMVLFGLLDPTLGGTITIWNPNNLAGFQSGDSWRLFDVSAGSIASPISVNYSALNLGPSLSGSFDYTSETFSVVPEPGRAMLLALGGVFMILRRRRS